MCAWFKVTILSSHPLPSVGAPLLGWFPRWVEVVGWQVVAWVTLGYCGTTVTTGAAYRNRVETKCCVH